MKNFYHQLLTVCCLLFISACAFAQPGVLDITFGNKGKVITPIPDSSHITSSPWSMIIQPDGKILTAGATKIGTRTPIVLVRYTANGSLDNSFGTQGVVYADDSIPPGYSATHPEAAIALQTDGKILCTRMIGDFVVHRFNANGTPDNTFGRNSVVQTNLYGDSANPFFTNSFDQSSTVKVRANGKIVVGGNNYGQQFNIPNTVGIFVAQYNTNGTLDSSFGSNGLGFYPTYDIANERFHAQGMEIQPDGKILLAGTYLDSTLGATFAVLRFNANGTIDNTFGNGGMFYTAVSNNNLCYAMSLQPDGKIILAGQVSNNTTYKFHIGLLRLSSSGTFDTGFGIGGKVITSFGNFDDMAQTMQLQADGKIIVGGAYNLNYSPNQNTGDFALLRYNADGTLDSAYGRHGIITTHFLNNDMAYSSAIQPDGKIVLAGVADLYNQRMFALARYEPMAMTKYNTIEGIVFLDKNANAVKDAGEPVFTNAAITVIKPNVDTSVTNNSSGYFSIDVDSGSYVTSVIPYRPYFTVVPASQTTAHASYFNTDNLSFALQPIVGKRDLAIEAVSVWRAVPGFENRYDIHYYNNGTDAMANASIQFIKSSKHTFNSAFPAPSSINGDTLHWVIASLNPQESGDISVSCTLQPPPSANIGDTIIVQASISSNATDLTPNDNFSLKKEIARGAFDPNDKAENHAGKITLVKAISGEYLTYTIRFQNTGNDTAFNVYIRDTMDNKLDWSSLQIVASSHNYQMTMNDGKCLFTFPDINLVDSIKNEPKSHGYIVYKIKAKPTVQIGNVIKNTAAIYFDYNLPIYTNTEMTTVVAETFPLKLLSFIAKRQDKTNVLQWATTQEVNVDGFEVQRSHNGREFSKIGAVKAGSLNYTFADNTPLATTNYYRLKMMDKDGSFTYSPIRSLTINNSPLTISIYPNPAKDNLQVQIDSEEPTTLQMQVLSLEGKLLLSNSFSASEGSSLRSINISALQKGSYLLKVVSSNKEKSVVKFEK